MKRGLQIASGISVLFTTLGFGHIAYRNTVHMATHHGASHLFIGVHTVVAIVFGILSLLGAFFLLAGGRSQNPA